VQDLCKSGEALDDNKGVALSSQKIADVARNPAHLKLLEEWIGSYTEEKHRALIIK